MTGYQEVLTDPSYAGQIVTMTAPQIGNYGVASGDAESQAPHVAGFVMREASPLASNWRADGTLRDYLVRHNIVAIADIDTRALTRVLRSAGVMRGVIATGQVDPGRAGREGARHSEDGRVGPRAGRHLRHARSSGATARRASGDADHAEFGIAAASGAPTRRLRVAAYDFGVKWNILRRLDAYGCDVHVFPASAPAGGSAGDRAGRHLPQQRPRRSGGAAVRHRQRARAGRQSDVPMFGICLGHQILGLAVGGETFKLKFGHRGANHPVKELQLGQGRDHVAEPRVRRRSRLAAGRRQRDAPEPVRRHGRRLPPHDEADFLGAVPSRGVARARTTPTTCSGSSSSRWRSSDALNHEDTKDTSSAPSHYRSSCPSCLVPSWFDDVMMPKRTDIKRVLVIGSGPIVIGQACEFDYSGTQACKALRAEGLEVVLVNSNPATIMTDPEMADRTYVEPLTPEMVEAIIAKERPDARAADRRRPDRAQPGGRARTSAASSRSTTSS